ncbi:hypothetical protein [Parachlamydia sp. AcF125]|uniref:hypothetical protein n=1 Tax=Parachlamydia sp. AcF125 TaxID=2795736 RepID=UPI001BCA2CE4|nr:hypothetical protein [Parachlamydia sp. AcF125]
MITNNGHLGWQITSHHCLESQRAQFQLSCDGISAAIKVPWRLPERVKLRQG